MDDIPPWAIGVWDQMRAAAANEDPHSYAVIAVDGLLRAAEIDAQLTGGRLDFDVAVRSAIGLEQATLVLIAAEAMCRLYNQEKR